MHKKISSKQHSHHINLRMLLQQFRRKFKILSNVKKKRLRRHSRSSAFNGKWRNPGRLTFWHFNILLSFPFLPVTNPGGPLYVREEGIRLCASGHVRTFRKHNAPSYAHMV